MTNNRRMKNQQKTHSNELRTQATNNTNKGQKLTKTNQLTKDNSKKQNDEKFYTGLAG
jgi:hypothetical protein